MLNRLNELQNKYPKHVSNARGRGLFCAIDLPTTSFRDDLRNILFADKLIILGCGEQSLRFRPHLNVSQEEIDLAIDKIDHALSKMAD